jgi:hypothetical protein
MIGVLVVGFLANLTIRPVSEWYVEPADTVRPLVASEG